MATGVQAEAFKAEVEKYIKLGLECSEIARITGRSLRSVQMAVSERCSGVKHDMRVATIHLGRRLGFTYQAIGEHIGISRQFCQRLAKLPVKRGSKPRLVIRFTRPVKNDGGNYITFKQYWAFPLGDSEVILKHGEEAHFVKVGDLVNKIEIGERVRHYDF